MRQIHRDRPQGGRALPLACLGFIEAVRTSSNRSTAASVGQVPPVITAPAILEQVRQIMDIFEFNDYTLTYRVKPLDDGAAPSGDSFRSLLIGD